MLGFLLIKLVDWFLEDLIGNGTVPCTKKAELLRFSYFLARFINFIYYLIAYR